MLFFLYSIGLISLCIKSCTETLGLFITSFMQFTNSHYELFSIVILLAVLIAVFIIDKFTNVRLRNIKTMAMIEQPYRPIIDLAVHRIFIAPNMVKYFLTVTGDPSNVNIVKSMFTKHGLLAYGYMAGYKVHGLLFTFGVYPETNSYVTVQISPIICQILRGQYRITTEGSDVIMINSRLQLFYWNNSNLQVATQIPKL